MNAPGFSKEAQTKLRETYKKLDPIELLDRIEEQQKIFWLSPFLCCYKLAVTA